MARKLEIAANGCEKAAEEAKRPGGRR